jgi:hypothetical protein
MLQAVQSPIPCTPAAVHRFTSRLVERICSENGLGSQRPVQCAGSAEKALLDMFGSEPVRRSTGKSRECLLIVGPSNSGKTTLGQRLAKRFGMSHLEMSTFALKRYDKHRRLQGFSGTLPDFMEEVVWSSGRRDTIARDLIAAGVDFERVVICGPRRVEEIEYLRRQDWNCRTIYLYAGDHTRFDRYLRSGEAERFGQGYREFVAKNLREYGWGLARAADIKNVELVVNEGSFDELVERVSCHIRESYAESCGST